MRMTGDGYLQEICRSTAGLPKVPRGELDNRHFGNTLLKLSNGRWTARQIGSIDQRSLFIDYYEFGGQQNAARVYERGRPKVTANSLLL